MFTRVFSSTAIPSASSTATVPDRTPSLSRTSSGDDRVFTISVPVGLRPAATSRTRASASWKTATTCGVSIGLLVRSSWSAGQKRTNDFTGEPFFSEPYEEKWAPFSPWRRTPAPGEDLPRQVGAQPADRLEADAEEAVFVGAWERNHPSARWTGLRQR